MFLSLSSKECVCPNCWERLGTPTEREPRMTSLPFHSLRPDFLSCFTLEHFRSDVTTRSALCYFIARGKCRVGLWNVYVDSAIKEIICGKVFHIWYGKSVDHFVNVKKCDVILAKRRNKFDRCLQSSPCALKSRSSFTLWGYCTRRVNRTLVCSSLPNDLINW